MTACGESEGGGHPESGRSSGGRRTVFRAGGAAIEAVHRPLRRLLGVGVIAEVRRAPLFPVRQPP